MAVRNNAFSRDSDADRADRLDLLVANIDFYAAELGVTGDRLTWAQGASEAWLAARSNAITESGEMEKAFQDFQDYVYETTIFYCNARGMLERIIKEYGGQADDILYQYGFKNSSPRIYSDLSAKMKMWLDMDAKLRTHVPPDPRVAPEAVITQLRDRLDNMLSAYQKAYSEKGEFELASKNKHDLFANDSCQLGILHMTAKLVWGDDDPRLRLLGFCPRSEIWSCSQPPAPKNFVYDDVIGEFSWDEVIDADLYEVMYRLSNASGDWSELYSGSERSTANKPPESGSYDFRVRAVSGDKNGKWSKTIMVDMI